ncbi:MAG: hypothetical protein ACYTFG_03055 [Planctomycetota bacterium]|jgi:hypothetical protein
MADEPEIPPEIESAEEESAHPQPVGSGEIGDAGAGIPHLPPARRWVYRGLTVVLGLVAALLMGEIFLRVTGFGSAKFRSKVFLEAKHGTTYDCYPRNPNGEFRPLPDLALDEWTLLEYSVPMRELPIDRLKDTPWCVQYHWNKLGLRDREYIQEPPENLLRIIGVGDSFAMGEGVPMPLSLFKRIEHHIESDVEVVNAAASGIGLAEYMRVLKELPRVLNARRALTTCRFLGIRSIQRLKEAAGGDPRSCGRA